MVTSTKREWHPARPATHSNTREARGKNLIREYARDFQEKTVKRAG
jgi:hypothetical protein